MLGGSGHLSATTVHTDAITTGVGVIADVDSLRTGLLTANEAVGVAVIVILMLADLTDITADVTIDIAAVVIDMLAYLTGLATDITIGVAGILIGMCRTSGHHSATTIHADTLAAGIRIADVHCIGTSLFAAHRAVGVALTHVAVSQGLALGSATDRAGLGSIAGSIAPGVTQSGDHVLSLDGLAAVSTLGACSQTGSGTGCIRTGNVHHILMLAGELNRADIKGFDLIFGGVEHIIANTIFDTRGDIGSLIQRTGSTVFDAINDKAHNVSGNLSNIVVKLSIVTE